MTVRHLDETGPQLYIYNMRDPARAKLEAAESFMAKELRAVYQHPNWIKEIQKEGYSGMLKMLDTVNNFWGWPWIATLSGMTSEKHSTRAMWPTVTTWVCATGLKNRIPLLPQIAERMLEATRKDYWQASEQAKHELVEVYTNIATRHDAMLRHTGNRQRQPLAMFMQSCPAATQETLELHLLRLVEPLRITSRVAPMLRLVATIIPMGSALIAVLEGNSQGMVQSLVVAFSAVIITLLTASLSYFVLTIRRRWLFEELENILGNREALSHLRGVAHS